VKFVSSEIKILFLVVKPKKGTSNPVIDTSNSEKDISNPIIDTPNPKMAHETQ